MKGETYMIIDEAVNIVKNDTDFLQKQVHNT